MGEFDGASGSFSGADEISGTNAGYGSETGEPAGQGGMETGLSAETGSVFEIAGSSAGGMEFAGGGETGSRGPSEVVSSGTKEGISPVQSAVHEAGHESWEVPGTMQEAREYVNATHQNSVQSILTSHGQYMTQSGIERVQEGTKVNALTGRKMEARVGEGVAGYYTHLNGHSELNVRVMTYGQMERTTAHETQHFSSYNNEIWVPDLQRHSATVYSRTGLRETEMVQNQETGKVTVTGSKGQGLNEGMTNVYAHDKVAEINPENALENERNGSYPEATAMARELQGLVGKETMAEAYYGGNKEGLAQKVNEMARDETAFDRMQKAFDMAAYGDETTQERGVREIQTILATMYGNKPEEA